MPEGDPQGLVFLFSDETGPTAELTQAAAQLADTGPDRGAGSIAAVPGPPGRLGRDCLYLVSDIEEASRRIQAAGGRGHYLTPIVAGTGMGAAVAYAALAQAPDATLAGAASDGFTTRIDTKTPLCAGAPVHACGRRRLRVRAGPLPGWWHVAPAPTDPQVAGHSPPPPVGRRCRGEPSPEGGLGTRLATLIEAPLAAAAADTRPVCRWSSCR